MIRTIHIVGCITVCTLLAQVLPAAAQSSEASRKFLLNKDDTLIICGDTIGAAACSRKGVHGGMRRPIPHYGREPRRTRQLRE
jgi:hypothetical protein